MFSKNSLPLLDTFLEEKKVIKQSLPGMHDLEQCVLCQLCILFFPTGSSYWREGRSRKLCVLAHSKVIQITMSCSFRQATFCWSRLFTAITIQVFSSITIRCDINHITLAFTENLYTFIRSPGVSMLETCRPTLNVTFTSEKDLEMWSHTWFKGNTTGQNHHIYYISLKHQRLVQKIIFYNEYYL